MNLKKYRLAVLLTSLVLSIVLFTVGLLVLPDTLITQVSIGGTNSTMPKLLGLALPALLLAGFSVVFYIFPERTKYLIGSAAGLLVFLFVFIFNL